MGDYNKFAEIYARKTAEINEEVRSRDHYHELLPPNLQGLSILDVGCGSGQDAVYYSSKGAKVCGIDLSEKEIEMARKLNCGEFVVGDMARLPYASNSFDYVTCFYALQACENVKLALGEMIRVAKPGGTILVQTKHPTRNLLEGWQNDGKLDYYESDVVTSRILNKSIILHEPSHTLMDYLNLELLASSNLELFEEHSDFPASEQVIPGLNYPTYVIFKLKKK